MPARRGCQLSTMFSVCLSFSFTFSLSLFLLSSSVPTIRTLDGTDGSLAWPVAVVGVSDTAMKRSLAEGVLQAGVRNKRHRRPVLKFFGAHTHTCAHTRSKKPRRMEVVRARGYGQLNACTADSLKMKQAPKLRQACEGCQDKTTGNTSRSFHSPVSRHHVCCLR